MNLAGGVAALAMGLFFGLLVCLEIGYEGTEPRDTR